MTARQQLSGHIAATAPLLQALAAAHREPDRDSAIHAVFKAVDAALQEALGFKLFTILLYDEAITESIRVYANLAGDYPLGGRKKIVSQRWGDQVVRDGVPFIGNTADDLREVFSDHALIASLGCESVLNMPVRWAGKTVGSLNLLHEANWYKDVDLAAVAVIAQLVAPALMTVPVPKDPATAAA